MDAKMTFELYRMDGLKVAFNVVITSGQEANEAITNLLNSGFSVERIDPEKSGVMQVSAIVRGETRGDDGKITPKIWMYADWGKPEFGAQLTHYLNTAQDVAAFEAAAGVKVSDLPLVKGKAAPAKESSEFERSSQATSFAVMREQQEDEKSKTGYKWVLTRYVGAPSLTVMDKPTGQPANSQPERKAAGAEGQQQQAVGKPLTREETATVYVRAKEIGYADKAEIFTALNVERMEDYRGTAIEAVQTLEAKKFGDVPF